MRNRGAAVVLAACFAVIAANAAPADPDREEGMEGDSLRVRCEEALSAGDPAAAESLFAAAPPPTDPVRRHRHEILAARLAAGRGDWKRAEAVLRDWKRDEARRAGTGEILFWQGWAALHQARAEEADSLFVLASAYTNEPRGQDALEYRFAALREPSPALGDYLRGLPESPLPAALRITSLERVPDGSPLRPDALWRLVGLRLDRGDTSEARQTLRALVAIPAPAPGLLPVPVQKGLLLQARLAEVAPPDSAGAARAAYEELLIRHQQGAVPETARKRMKTLREP